MSQSYNIYCDESCHLENDNQDVMVLGAVWCPLESSRVIAKQLREIKIKHGLDSSFEIKWTKVSPAKSQFYLDLVDYFFATDDLNFRALVIPDKNKLQHKVFQQTHDDWYYKMYFTLLKVILDPKSRYRIYIDIKDTNSKAKIDKLHEVLCSSLYDFDRNIIERIQPVHSHEVEHIQLADLLTGVVRCANQKQTKSPAKKMLMEKAKLLSGYSLTRKTLLKEKKCNLLIWQPQENMND